MREAAALPSSRGWVWRGGGRGEEIVSSKVTAGRSRAVRLPPRRRGACDFHGRLRAAVWRGGERDGGGGGSERDSSDGFYCFKIQLQPEGCSAESCGPTTPPFPLHPPASHPPFSPQPRGKVPAGSRGRRQGMPGGGGAGAAAAVPPGSLRDYWGGGSGSGCCARLAAAAGGAGSLFC